jgi:hypothetical protein
MATIAIDKAYVVSVLAEIREFHAAHGHDVASIQIGQNPFCEEVRICEDNGAYEWFGSMERFACLGNPSATLLGIASMAQATLFGI